MSILKYPFSAVLGQEKFKLALILSAINPTIGGVLVSGPRGSAKSTLARGLADLLEGDQALVTLPLAATEDMLVGTLDLQKVLSEKEVSFSPGILSKAHNGVLYVDEVNLLSDPLVDLLLDVSTSGVNYVERDGISHQHASRFILLGTMNPDEGELRAQLLDRFGLSVNLDSSMSIDERIEIVRLRESFDRDAQAFIDSFQCKQQQLQQEMTKAKQQLTTANCSSHFRKNIAIRCHEANVDGIRADIVWLKAALAHAAWSGRTEVNQADIDVVEELVLAHRRQEQRHSDNSSTPNEPPPFSRPDNSKTPPQGTPEKHLTGNSTGNSEQPNETGEWGQMTPQTQDVSDEVLKFTEEIAQINDKKASTNKVNHVVARASKNSHGTVVGGHKVSGKHSQSINWFSTLISSLGQWPPQTFNFKKVNHGQPIINCILLDTSASTLKRMQFSRAKAVVMQLAKNAYKKREHLVVFGFGNEQVQTLISQQKAPKTIKKWLVDISAAGGTPLRDILNYLSVYQQKLLNNDPTLRCRNFLITDGRSSQQINDITLLGETTLIDIEDSQIRRGRGVELASQLNGQYVSVFT